MADEQVSLGSDPNAAPTGSGEQVAPATVSTDSTATGQPGAVASTETAAPQGTPAAGAADTGAEAVARAEKRIRDTEAALAERQKEFHNETRRMREEMDQLRAQRNQVDPAVIQQQREALASKLGVTTDVIEYFDQQFAGRDQFLRGEFAQREAELLRRMENYDPVVQKNIGLVNQLKDDPDFAGRSPAEIARMAEKLQKVRGPTHPERETPPPAPTGVRRPVETLKPKGPLTDAMLGMIHSHISGKDSRSLS